MSAFTNWCLLRGESSVPASPTVIVRFLRECAALGIDRVWNAMVDISKQHHSLGLPDPTLGISIVTAEINKISGIEPPRSWTKEMQHRFMTLPWDLQNQILIRETQRDRELRRLQNEVAELKRAPVAA
jgi:hypothetical protein